MAFLKIKHSSNVLPFDEKLVIDKNSSSEGDTSSGVPVKVNVYSTSKEQRVHLGERKRLLRAWRRLPRGAELLLGRPLGVRSQQY